MIIGLFTDLLGVGGIQRICRHVALVLESYARKDNQPVSMLSLLDSENTPCILGKNFAGGDEDCNSSIRGFSGSRWYFSIAAVSRGVHSHTIICGHVNLSPLAWLISLLRPSISYIVIVYGIEVWRPLPLILRTALHRADKIVSISKFTADQITEQHRVAPRRVLVIHPTVDPDWDSDVPKVEQESNLLLSVTRLEETEKYKGVSTVIRALPAIIAHNPDTQYVIIGDGSDRERLESLGESLGVQDNIRFLGTLQGRVLREWYQRSTVFVLPSQGEGFGVVFLEAMALGRPVIAGYHGGSQEIVVHGHSGYLVHPGNKDALVGAITRLLDDPELCRRMGERGRRRFLEKYSFGKFATRWQRLTEEMA